MELIPLIRIEDADGNIDINDRNVKRAFDLWLSQQPRYKMLRDYYLGRHKITFRDEGAKVVNNMCKYTTDAILGFMTGHPIGYSCSEENTAAHDLIKSHLGHNGQSQDADIIKCMSIYGRGYKLVYHDDDTDRTPKSTVLDPTQAFVCYTGTVEPKSLFGATVMSTLDDKGMPIYYLTVYTDKEIQFWQSRSPADLGGIQTYSPRDVKDDKFYRTDDPDNVLKHKCGRVPLVEYRNNMECMGDFEQIISLQDAYNEITSDRVDDKNTFGDAMLLIKGAILGMSPDEVKENSEQIKKSKVLQLPDDPNVSAEWMTKVLNEADVQVLADSLMNNMHKFAKVPNLADSEFSQNASGVAMQYKLYGTDLLAGEKAKKFIASQKYYFKCLDAGYHNALGDMSYPKTDVGDIAIRFKYTVPSDLSYEANTLATLKSTGLFSDETLRTLASFLDDPSKEKTLVEAQQKIEEEREKRMYADEFGIGKEE